MEKFYFEVPTMKRKDEAINFILEHNKYNSNINGTGGLHRYLDDYEGWLEKLERDYNTVPNEERVPARTYFLIRENDDRIVGMINIRTALNERLSKFGGHIGYGIRPTERGKGYNKINLYLGLKVCNEYGIDRVFMDADLDNPASWKTMEAFGGVRVKEYYSEEEDCVVVDYNIDVKNALKTYKDVYEPYIARDIDEVSLQKKL
jgi:predicted acetyltransferase